MGDFTAQRAEASQKRADLTLVEMQTSRGLVAASRNNADEAALWFAEAAGKAKAVSDLVHEEPNRLRARNWLSQTTVPVAALNLGGTALQLSFEPAGDLLLVRSESRVLLWNWRDGKLIPWSEGLTGVLTACFSPTGKSIALAFSSGDVEIRNLANGSVSANLKSTVGARSLAFSHDGTVLAVGSPIVRLWDVAQHAFLPATCKHPLPVNAMAFNRRGDRLITACEDKQARVFDFSSDRAGS